MPLHKPNLLERTWEGFAKVKYPSLVIGSQEWNERRHAFFVGVFTCTQFIQKTPASALAELMNDIFAEAKAEVYRDNTKNIVGPNGNAINLS